MALEQMRDMPDLSKVKLDATMVEKGIAVYDRYCVNCHGAGAVGGGVIPDLRYSAMLSAPQVWQQVVWMAFSATAVW